MGNIPVMEWAYFSGNCNCNSKRISGSKCPLLGGGGGIYAISLLKNTQGKCREFYLYQRVTALYESQANYKTSGIRLGLRNAFKNLVVVWKIFNHMIIWICRIDCRDGSDEERCHTVCGPDEFRCYSDGSCIQNRYKCDYDKVKIKTTRKSSCVNARGIPPAV